MPGCIPFPSTSPIRITLQFLIVDRHIVPVDVGSHDQV